MKTALTDREWQTIMPFVHWRKPITVETPSASGLACRLCLARYGLTADVVAKLPQTLEQFNQHLANEHPDLK